MGSKRLKMDIPTASKGECPVCFQIPRGKIFNICANGHYLCEACSTKVTICPECRSTKVISRNLLAERLLDDIDFKCSWSGCDETLKRGELSAHENQCDKNPDTIQFCSVYPKGRKCHYKFTSKWLSEPENYMHFLEHVKRCLGYRSHADIHYGKRNRLNVGFTSVMSENYDPSRGVYLTYRPVFHRLKLPNQDKVEVFFLMALVKVDKLGNKCMSFAYIQLTPETTQTVIKFTINPSPNSRMNSQWGQNSLASLNWTQKTTGFKQFAEMVESFENSLETGIPLPFSFPISFLSEYYVNENRKLVLNYSLEQTF